MDEKQVKAKLRKIIESVKTSRETADKLLLEVRDQKIFDRFKSVLIKESK